MLGAAPCSIELPAGTGKTHLLAAAVKQAALSQHRTLILTHTNAGVDAIRGRLREFNVSPKLYYVDTITGWAFTLARSYQVIAGIIIPDVPDWSDSDRYHRGAVSVASSAIIQQVLANSYKYLFVDEYQDCTQVQHELVLALRNSIPRSIVFGDRLQGIFGFGDNIIVDWREEVITDFAPHTIEIVPHRWKDSNLVLGQLTLDLRKQLADGNEVVLDSLKSKGVVYIPGDPRETLAPTCYDLTKSNESVAVLTKWPNDEDRISQQLSGSFNVVEPISGTRMIKSLESIAPEGDAALALWFAETAKKFHVGLSGIDGPVLSKLRNGESVRRVARQGLQELINSLAELQENPTYAALLRLSGVPSGIEGVRCSHKEAWRDIFRAIEYGIEEDSPDMVRNLAAVRSRYKHMKRSLPRLIVSRTLIVKGLEFDHVVIADLESFSDPRNLYVALTRARKSATILGKSPRIVLRSGN